MQVKIDQDDLQNNVNQNDVENADDDDPHSPRNEEEERENLESALAAMPNPQTLKNMPASPTSRSSRKSKPSTSKEPSLPTNTLQSLWIVEHLQMAEHGNVRNVDGMMIDSSKDSMRSGTDSGYGPQIKMSGTVEVSCEGGADPIRKLTLGQLEVEGKKLEGNAKVALTMEHRGGVEDKVIAALLRPREWTPPREDDPFCINRQEVFTLCENVERLLQKEPMCLQLRAPIKVFGDIHGQFSDLMRLFARYKCPRDGEDGDIDAVDYLFLGDYVDRGCHSLEVICLLFALKLKFPRQIHLIRGNHEDPTINAVYGFFDECCRRLGDNPNNPEDEHSCWARFNHVFEWMPCGAVIEDRILCIHGGIGGSVKSVDQIKKYELFILKTVFILVLTFTHVMIYLFLWIYHNLVFRVIKLNL